MTDSLSKLAAVLLLAPAALWAQDSVRVARTARIATAPQIDGRLDDAVWQEATPLTDFVQRDPSEGAPSTERTEVRILTDGEALYIGAWLFDRDAAAIVPGERIRDVEQGPDGSIYLATDESDGKIWRLRPQ